MTTTTQLSLFELSTQISLTEETVAVNFRGRWEIYMTGGHPGNYVDASWLERFSHFATPGEALQCYGLAPRPH